MSMKIRVALVLAVLATMCAASSAISATARVQGNGDKLQKPDLMAFLKAVGKPPKAPLTVPDVPDKAPKPTAAQQKTIYGTLFNALDKVTKTAELGAKKSKAQPNQAAMNPKLIELQTATRAHARTRTRLNAHPVDPALFMSAVPYGKAPGGKAMNRAEQRRAHIQAWCNANAANTAVCGRLPAGELAFVNAANPADSHYHRLKLAAIQANLLAEQMVDKDTAIIGELAAEPTLAPHVPAGAAAWGDHILGQAALTFWTNVMSGGGGVAALPVSAHHPIRRWMAAAATTAYPFQGLGNYPPNAAGDNQGVVYNEIATFQQWVALPARGGALTAPQRSVICKMGLRAAAAGMIDLVALYRLQSHPALFGFIHTAYNNAAVPVGAPVGPARAAPVRAAAAHYRAVQLIMANLVTNPAWLNTIC